MRQTAVLVIMCVAVWAAVSMANPIEDVREQIDAESVADFLQETLKFDIPDDMVVSEITIHLEPKDSSKEVQSPRDISSRGSSVPATGGRGRTPGGPRGQYYPARSPRGQGYPQSLSLKPIHNRSSWGIRGRCYYC